MRRGGPRTARMKGALAALLLTLPLAGLPGAARALDAIAMDDAHPVIDLTPFVETYAAEGRLTIEPPDNGSASVEADPEADAGEIDEALLEDGSIVLADGETEGTGVWRVFALRNRAEDETLRLLVADRRGEGLMSFFW